MLARSAKVYWGLVKGALDIIYKGAILPLLTYAAPVLSSALGKKYNVRRLRSVQRKFALRVIRGYRTISYHAATTLAGMVPIDLKIKELVDVYVVLRKEQDTFFLSTMRILL